MVRVKLLLVTILFLQIASTAFSTSHDDDETESESEDETEVTTTTPKPSRKKGHSHSKHGHKDSDSDKKGDGSDNIDEITKLMATKMSSSFLSRFHFHFKDHKTNQKAQNFDINGFINRLNQGSIKGIREEDLTDDLETYEPPAIILKNFPYYISGYDDEKRSIYVAEIGKFDLRTFVEMGEETQENLLHYCKQVGYRILKRMKQNGTDEFIAILDSEGLELRQMTSLQSLSFLIKIGILWRNFGLKHVGGVYIINANFVTEQFVHLAKPIMGKLMEKVEVFGGNKQKWMPTLRRDLGPENLPPFYGGSKNFKPVAVYG